MAAVKGKCDKCLELEIQLKEALSELSSAQLINEILQKGSKVSMCPEYITNSIHTTSYAEADQEVNSNWELVTSRYSCEPKVLKKIEKHFTLPISKTVSTTNRFSMLGISESDRSDKVLVTATRQEAPNIMNKHQNSANKPVSFKTPQDKSSYDPHNLIASPHNPHDRERETIMKQGDKGNPVYSIPTIVNGCVTTAVTVGVKTLRKDKSNNSGKRMVKLYNNKAGNKRNHKIVIIGDSHSTGLAKEVKNHLRKNFEISGLVKPGAGAEILANSAMSDIAN
jgi:hypothetical protein